MYQQANGNMFKIGAFVYSVTRLKCVYIAQMKELKFEETEENAIMRTTWLTIKLMEVVPLPPEEVFLRPVGVGEVLRPVGCHLLIGDELVFVDDNEHPHRAGQINAFFERIILRTLVGQQFLQILIQ